MVESAWTDNKLYTNILPIIIRSAAELPEPSPSRRVYPKGLKFFQGNVVTLGPVGEGRPRRVPRMPEAAGYVRREQFRPVAAVRPQDPPPPRPRHPLPQDPPLSVTADPPLSVTAAAMSAAAAAASFARHPQVSLLIRIDYTENKSTIL